MEVKVKLQGIEKLKLATKVENDEGICVLKTQISFEVEGNLEALARVLSLARQNKPISAVIGCDQAMFDLAIARVPEKDKPSKATNKASQPSEAGKSGEAGQPSEASKTSEAGNGNGHGSDEQGLGIVGQEKDKDTAKDKASASP